MFDDNIRGMQNMVEHTLNLYAKDLVLLPADYLYDEQILAQYSNIIENCHIYIVGEVPQINILSTYENQSCMCFDLELFAGKKLGTIKVPIPSGWQFAQNESEGAYIINEHGQKRILSVESIFLQISKQLEPLTFKVLYIGQAYGESGKRNAIDRLLKHSTLQKIAIIGAPVGYRLQIILISLHENKLIMSFNPFAKDTKKVSSKSRISQGTETLSKTSEEERVTLYEAAMIRYFQPQYNIQFKDSFPSTNLKILADCYNRDMQSLVAEFCFDEQDLVYELFSEKAQPSRTHIANFDLHKESDRKSFFSASQTSPK